MAQKTVVPDKSKRGGKDEKGKATKASLTAKGRGGKEKERGGATGKAARGSGKAGVAGRFESLHGQAEREEEEAEDEEAAWSKPSEYEGENIEHVSDAEPEDDYEAREELEQDSLVSVWLGGFLGCVGSLWCFCSEKQGKREG